MIRTLYEGLLADGISVPLTKPFAWFGIPRRTLYDRPVKVPPTVDPRFAEPIKKLIEAEPSFAYRTVAWLRGVNKNTVQHVFQLKGGQVRKRPVGARPRIEAFPSVAQAPNERWSTDLCRVWAGKDGWTTLALVMDCHTRELLRWHLSRSGKATPAASALEHPLIARFSTLGRVKTPCLVRSDNGLVVTSRAYTKLVRGILRCSGFLVHLRALIASMNQKSSVAQTPKSVRWVLTSDRRAPARRRRRCSVVEGLSPKKVR
ncbi:MAG: DDE-type integrase/transposase/recombinase [Geminicoccaceae bacterium]